MRCVVALLAARKLPAAEIAARSRHDPTVDEGVRTRALSLAERGRIP